MAQQVHNGDPANAAVVWVTICTYYLLTQSPIQMDAGTWLLHIYPTSQTHHEVLTTWLTVHFG